MRGDKNRSAVLYLVTNTVNGKTYVGVTSRKDVRRRMSEHFYSARKGIHNGAFYRAIRKYDRSVFRIDVIANFETCHAALEAEVAYIAEHAPKYNSTRGGEAGGGTNLTPEGRRKIGEASRGNKYRLGQTHSPEVREILREHGLNRRALFEQYASLGPQAMARRVRCMDDNTEWPSASAAARHFNVSKSALIELCLGKNYRKTVGGLRFEYAVA